MVIWERWTLQINIVSWMWAIVEEFDATFAVLFLIASHFVIVNYFESFVEILLLQNKVVFSVAFKRNTQFDPALFLSQLKEFSQFCIDYSVIIEF